MANIREVAEKANVAKCTVSRVLNNNTKVSEKTRKIVLKAMEELAYTPNELARGMFKQKSGIIAMIVPSISHPFFSRLASHIEVELYKNGYRLMFCSSKGSYEKEKDYLNVFKTNLVDGIIFGVSNLDKEIYEGFDKPMVMLDRFINDHIPVVVSNHTLGGSLAAKEFINSGCKHVIHIGSHNSKDIISYKSHSALNRVLSENKIVVEEIDIQWDDFEFEKFYEIALNILKENESIDGVMAADLLAAAFIKAAFKLGKKVPEDISIISYDGTYVSNIGVVDMTKIIQPLSTIAKEATKLLFNQIEKKENDNNYVEVDLILERGETTKNTMKKSYNS